MNHTKRLIQGGIATVVMIALISFSIIGIMLLPKVQRLEIKMNNLEKHLDYQISINTTLYDELEVLETYVKINEVHIDSNMDRINQNAKRMIQNSVDIDQQSVEGINLVIEEILEDIKYIEKRLK